MWYFPHRVVMWLVQYWDEKLRTIRSKEPALRWEVNKGFLSNEYATTQTPLISHNCLSWPLLFHCSISKLPMPTVQPTLTVSRERLTLMAMVLFLFLTKSFFKLVWSVFVSVFISIKCLSCRQKDWQMRPVLQPHLQNLWDPNLVSYWGVRCSTVS